MSSTDTLGLLKKYRTANSPPVEGWQAQPDGVVFSYPTNLRKLVGADLYIRPQCIFLAYSIVCHLVHGNDSCGAWRLRLYRHNALGQICKSAPATQSAALFCPYHFRSQWCKRLGLCSGDNFSTARMDCLCKNNAFRRTYQMPIDLLACSTLSVVNFDVYFHCGILLVRVV